MQGWSLCLTRKYTLNKQKTPWFVQHYLVVNPTYNTRQLSPSDRVRLLTWCTSISHVLLVSLKHCSQSWLGMVFSHALFQKAALKYSYLIPFAPGYSSSYIWVILINVTCGFSNILHEAMPTPPHSGKTSTGLSLLFTKPTYLKPVKASHAVSYHRSLVI